MYAFLYYIFTSLWFRITLHIFVLQDAVHGHIHSYTILQHKLQEEAFKMQSQSQLLG